MDDSRRGESAVTGTIEKSEEEWRRELTPEQYRILRKKGTERAFTGEYHDSKTPGTYMCAGCGEPLFEAEHKFDSGTGWPSFYRPASPDSINTEPDNSLFMRRTEVLCRTCGGHLGHVFDDGPNPTGRRYCINSAALDLCPLEGGAETMVSGGSQEDASSTGGSPGEAPADEV